MADPATPEPTDRHGRPLGGDRERDGRLLAAAQGIDLTAGAVDDRTRAHWYERADVARAKLVDWAEHPSDCLCRHGHACRGDARAEAEARPHDDEACICDELPEVTGHHLTRCPVFVSRLGKVDRG